MPHGRWLLGACCVAAFGCSLFVAICLFDEGLSEPMDIANIRNHALKCTCLSVAAKLGVSAEERKFRGYHTSSAGEVVLYYSRDEIADPLRALDGVIKMVRDCSLFPMQIGWALLQRRQSKLGNVVALMLQLMLMSLLET